MLPLASANPANPVGERWWMRCCIQANFALPFRSRSVSSNGELGQGISVFRGVDGLAAENFAENRTQTENI